MSTRVALDVSAIPATPTGAGVYVVELVRALGGASTAHDVELHLVARRGDAARWAGLAPGAPVHPAVPTTRPARLVWEQSRAAHLARRLDVDVWHGPHYTMPLRVRAPAVVTVHDLTFFDHPEWHERSKVTFFRRMIRAAVERARVIVCVSQATADRLGELLHPDAPVLVVPHGIDHRRFHPRSTGTDAADRAVLEAVGVRPPFIAFVGTVEPRKNVPGLVRAFARVAPAHPELSLVVAGVAGWDGGAYDREVAATGFGDRVIRLGYVADEVVPALYRQAAGVVYPAFEEGFGLPALEALACGAPVVTTAGSVMGDIAGNAAVLVPPGDDAALGGAIAEFVAGGSETERLRRAGPAVAAGFTWERCAERHVDAYRAAAS